MRHSINKRRDMARSILPSTDRRAMRRALAATRRSARRRYRRQLAYGVGFEDLEMGLDRLDPRDYPDHLIRQLVRRRRGADKLNHFERWAVQVTGHLPIESRLGALRAMLPGGLVGEHAMSHLVRLDELNPHHSWRWYESRLAREARARQWADRLARVEADVRRALADGRHCDLNRAMKAAPVGDPPAWRTLGGVHDVEEFVRDVSRVKPWLEALERYLARTARFPRAPPA